MLGLVTEISDGVQSGSPNPLHIRDGLRHTMQRRQPRISTSRRRTTGRDAAPNLTGKRAQMRTKLAQSREINLEHILVARHSTAPLRQTPPVIHSTLQQP